MTNDQSILPALTYFSSLLDDRGAATAGDGEPNYRGISLHNIEIKSLRPTFNKLIGSRPRNSIIEQIFTMRQILRKIDTHHLSIDFKAALDSTVSSCH